jgi:fimbrial chaperone protein
VDRRTVIAGLAAQMLLPAGAARASAMLGVAPTLIELGAGNANTILYVSNGGDEALTAQLRLFAWRNEDGEEQYSASGDIGFSPGQFGVPAGDRQTVRLALLTGPGPIERAYRLIVDQLPGSAATGLLHMPVRMIVPVFAAPAGPAPRAPPTLVWSAIVDRASRIATLSASNPGVRRVRLAELRYAAGGPPVVLYEGLAGYALAGGGWSGRFRMAGEPASIEIAAMTESGRIGATVPVVYR